MYSTAQYILLTRDKHVFLRNISVNQRFSFISIAILIYSFKDFIE